MPRDQLVPKAKAGRLAGAAGMPRKNRERTGNRGSSSFGIAENDLPAIMPATRRLHRYTYADYVALELQSSTKHEFLDGQIYAMIRGSEEHSALSAEVLRMFSKAAADGLLHVYSSHLRIYVAAVGLATFPDGCVVRGAFEHHSPSPRPTGLNPMVLLEVTSDSSQEYDTGLKLEWYQTIPTLREYVVVSHRERSITVHARPERGAWRTRVGRAGGRVGVASLKMDLVVDEVYRKISLA